MGGVISLSQKLHEALGQAVAQELEASFEKIDAMNRAAFRELFDVKLSQRLAETKAELRQEIGGLEGRLRQEMATLRVELASTETRLIRWMFLFCVGTIGISIAQRL